MSEAVDTRIVEARFDSSQFEKGVDRTVKKLDELKKSMTFEETGKSIADLTSKAQEATEKASNSLEKLENRITSFTGMLKQKLLGGIADEIVGAIFKVKNSIEGLVKSLSTSQISTGMYKYEQMLTSVRTMIAAGDTEKSAYKAIGILGQYADQTSYSLDQMTSALSKMRAAGVDLETGTKAVEGISNACAAAGVNATDASRAFYNLSQAYSSGYLKYTDYRSLELLNMTTENFKKQMLEAAEAAGTLQKVSDGVYKTINKNDKKVTAGKKVTEKNLTEALKYNIMNTEAMNLLFGEKYFFDEEKWNEIKEEFKDIADEDKREQKVLEVAKERYGEIAVNAYFAAREARSFTDVLNTLKDVVSRGWATSFELIFGRLEDAKKFFTWLAESDLANAIYAISDFRNKVLETWADDGGREAFMDALKKIDELLGKILGNFTIFGSDTEAIEKKAHNLGDSLYQSTLRLRDNIEKISKWLTEPLDDKGTTRIERIGKVFKTLGRVISGASRVIAIGMKFIGNLFVLLAPVFDSFEGILEKVTNALLNLTDPINDNKGAYKSLEDGLDNIIKIAEPFVSVLSTVLDVLGDVAAFFVEIATGTFAANIGFFSDILGFVLELFGKKSAQAENGVGVIEGIKNDIVSLGEACKDALGFVGKFFENLFKDLGKLFGLKDETDTTEQGGFFSNIINFFDSNEFIQKAKAWIDQAIIDIGNFIRSIPDRIVELANNLWDTVNGILWNKDYSETTYQNIKRCSSIDAEKYKESMKSPFHKFVEGLINTVKDFIISLPETITDLVGKAGNFITDVINGIFDFFTKEQDYSGSETDSQKKVAEGAKEGLETGFDHIKSIVVDFVKSLPEKIWNALKTIGTTALNIGNKIWKFIDELIFGKVAYTKNVYNKDTKTWKKITVRYKKGFSKWLDDTVKSIKDFFTNPEKIKEIWNTIVDFFFGRQATEEDTKRLNPKTGKNYKLTDRVKEGFSEWLDNTITAVKDWILTIPGKISNIWNMIIDFIFGREATEADFDTQNPVTGENYKPTERVKEGFSLWIHDIWTKIKTWFTSGQILKDIEGIWNKVVDFIFGKEQTFTVVKPETGEEHQVTMRVKEGFSKWLNDTITSVKKWLGGMNGRIMNLWNTVLDAIFGGPASKGFDQEFYEQLLKDDPSGYGAHQYKDYFDHKKGGIIEAADSFLKSIGIDLGALISNIPTYIAQGWDFSVDLFGSLLGHIEEWLDKKTLEAEAKKTAKDGAEAVDKAVSDAAAEEDQTGFFKVIVEIGQKIKGMITETIPSILKKAWPVLKDESKNLISAARGIFERLTVGDLSESAQNAANNIAETIKNMPSYIRKAIKTFKNLFTSSDFDMTKTGKKLEMPLPSVEYSEEEFKKLLASGKVKIEHLKKDLTKTVTEEVSDDSGVGFSLWGSIKDIGSAIGEAIGALGPDILAGVNKAFEWINGQISNFTQKLAEKPDDTPFFEWLTGLIGGKDKQSSGLATVIQNIGKTLKTLIIETIPKFLGEAFAELAAGIPRFFNSLFGGGNEETEAVAEEVGKELGGSNVETIAKGYTEGFNEQVKAVMKNAGGGFDLSWLFSWMNPIGSANAEDEFPTEDGKNMINKQEKITEISKKLEEEQAKQTEALNKNNASDYFRATKNIEVYQKMLTILKECEGEMIDASVLDKAGKIEEAEEKVSIITQILKRIGEIFNSLTDVNTIKTAFVIAAIGVILWSLKTIIDQIAVLDDIGYTIKWTGITVGILGIVGLIGYLIYLGETGQEDKLKKIKETFESVKGLITSFMGLVVAIRGLGVVKGIADIGKVVGQASTITNSTVTTNVTKGTFGQGFGQGIGGVLGKLVSALSTGGFIWLILQQLPAIIESVADAKVKLKAAGASENLGSDMLYVMGGVAAVLASTSVIGIALAGVQKVAPTGLDPMATLNTVISLVEIVTGASLVITAIQGLNSLLEKYLGEGKDVFSGFKKLGETIASLLSSLGEGIGGFLYGLTHGESIEKSNERKQESVEKMFNLLKEASKEMPIEQLETIVSLTERMVGLYERLDGLGTRIENVKTIVAATDVAGTFRTISQAVLEILTAFDTAEQEQYKILGKAVTERDFFGGDQNNYTTEDFANDLTEGYDLASRDYSVWKSFAEGGSAYEAIQQYVNILSDVVSSLSGAISPNLIDLLSKDTQTYNKFWERLNKFFMGSDGENSGFSDVIEYIKTAYATIEANYEALKPYTDSKYSNIIDAINNLFSIFMNLMPEGDTAVAVLTQGSTEDGPYAKWYFRIRNMLDWGPSGSQNDFEDLIQRVVEAYKILGKYDAQLSQYKNANFIGLIQGIYNVFGMFSQDDGVGSGTWLDNYMAFKKKLNESGFIENYVKDLEKIFEAFKTSALYDPETGMMGSLYFDGASIVKNLFDAINAGLQSENLPELDASAVGDAILKAIRVSDKELEIAKAVHQMIQDGLLTFNTNTELGSFDTSGMSEMSEAMKQLLEQFNGAENGIMTLFGSDEGIAKINSTVEGLSGLMSPENILGEDSETWIKEMQDIWNAAGLDEETLNPKITPVLEITDDFTNKVNTMRQMLGYNPMQEVNGVLDMSWRLADAIKIPEQYDYTEKLDIIIDHMGTLNNSVSEFNDSMSNMTIAVDGEEFGTTIYPFVEKAAGWNLVTNQRPGVGE